MRKWLIKHGVNKKKIIKENKSMQTYDNIYNSNKIITELNQENIIIVSSPSHLPKIKKIANVIMKTGVVYISSKL
jgi:uncharacterized SAM-binding protein YcdF (DUF218 family)